MRGAKTIPLRTAPSVKGAGDNLHGASSCAEELMDLALDAAQSKNLPDFLRQFSARAGRMLKANWCGVAVFQGEEADLYSSNSEPGKNTQTTRSLAKAILETAYETENAIHVVNSALKEFPAADRADTSLETVLTRIDSGDGERLGCLCLLRKPQPLGDPDLRLLRALASHAALSLVNFRRFSQLERSKRQWVEDIDAITDYIVVHDRSWRILRTNRTLASVLGAAPVALVGEAMTRLGQFAGAGSGLPCPLCRDSLRAREEYVVATREGTFLVSTSRTPSAAEKDVRTVHVLKDITDRLEAERRYRELFDSIQEGLFFASPDGRFLDVNGALVRMLGYGSREELLRAEVSRHLYPDPASRKRVLSALNERGVLRNYEESLRRKDGSLLHSLQYITAVRDAHGEIVQIRGLMLDVTEQRLIQTQLQRERDFNQKILNTTQSMILVLDTTGLITYANKRCSDAGYHGEELIGCRLVDWVESVQRLTFEAALEATAQGEHVENLELHMRRSDATEGQFSVSLSPMRDEQGVVNSIVVVMTDITDAVILQAKLAHAEKMATIGRLVSGVAHEVNNPLAAILGFTDLLLENPEVPGKAKEDLQIILQETQRTKDIVQDLLSFARQRPARRERVQINAVLRQTLKLRSYDFASHGVEVIEMFEEDLDPVLGDAQELQQVFLNIVNNAYDAVQEARRTGRIQIRTSQREKQVEVTVTDNGTGISQPERIFDPFFTTKQPGKGTGLGLSICYGIVRAHAGEIQCWNNAGGEGSTFAVRIPAATESAFSAAATEAGR
ncbi:MAG TPA: PAS domain S-box protein [Candidatus Acidoferrum sp.]|nr:PAS domain S-box protein [Candidatus Acidoferrum sp.]